MPVFFFLRLLSSLSSNFSGCALTPTPASKMATGSPGLTPSHFLCSSLSSSNAPLLSLDPDIDPLSPLSPHTLSAGDAGCAPSY